jgi:hypothetical protein
MYSVKRHVSGVLRRPSPIHQTWSRSRLGHQTALKSTVLCPQSPLKSTVLCPQTALKSTALCPQAAPGRRSSPCSLLQAAVAPPVLRRRSRSRLLRRSFRPPLGRARRPGRRSAAPGRCSAMPDAQAAAQPRQAASSSRSRSRPLPLSAGHYRDSPASSPASLVTGEW